MISHDDTTSGSSECWYPILPVSELTFLKKCDVITTVLHVWWNPMPENGVHIETGPGKVEI